MLQAFIIVLREGIEAFLIVAITLAYLRKTGQYAMVRSVFVGVGASVIISGLLGYFLWLTQGIHQPVIEGSLALITAGLVLTLVVHMWRIGPTMKKEMEGHLEKVTARQTAGAHAGVFFFTTVMISREGMETALLLFQIHDAQIVTGCMLGLAAAVCVAWLWQQFGYLINMKTFFQVTAVFLLLFTVQILVQSFHEFTEAGIFPNSEYLHKVSEPYSTEGIYGQMFATVTMAGCGLWLLVSWLFERIRKKDDILVPVTVEVNS